MQADMLNGLSANKFNQVLTNLCNASNSKKYGKFIKNAKRQNETKDMEVMNGFQLTQGAGINSISEAIAGMKQN